MPIIGHQIKKIVGKKGESEKEVNIHTNVELINVKKNPVFVAGEKKTSVEFEFEFTVKYGIKAGGIDIIGSMIYTGAEEELTKIEKKWAKDKKLEPNLVVNVLNRAVELGYLEAIHLAERLKLPSPMRMPRATMSEEKKK